MARLAADDEIAATAQRPAPASRAERIEAIDALRGLALFGVLMVWNARARLRGEI